MKRLKTEGCFNDGTQNKKQEILPLFEEFYKHNTLIAKLLLRFDPNVLEEINQVLPWIDWRGLDTLEGGNLIKLCIRKNHVGKA